MKHGGFPVPSAKTPQLFLMFRPKLVDGHSNLVHIVLSLLDSSSPIALSPPALDVLAHLCQTTLLFLDLVTQLAVARLVGRIVDELHPTGFTRSIFLRTLLPKVAPFPISTLPSSLFKITHGS